MKNYLIVILTFLFFSVGNIYSQEKQTNSYVYPTVTLTYTVFDSYIDVYASLSSTEGVTSIEWVATPINGGQTLKFTKSPQSLSIITLPADTYRVTCSPMPTGNPPYYMIMVFPYRTTVTNTEKK